MFVGNNKVFEAIQFWDIDEEILWPEGVYSDGAATPSYFIDISATPTPINTGDYVVFDDPVTVVSLVDFLTKYETGVE